MPLAFSRNRSRQLDVCTVFADMLPSICSSRSLVALFVVISPMVLTGMIISIRKAATILERRLLVDLVMRSDRVVLIRCKSIFITPPD